MEQKQASIHTHNLKHRVSLPKSLQGLSLWHVIHHATATGQINEVAGYRLCRGGKGKSKAAEKILGKGENGLIELGSMKRGKKQLEKKSF